MSQLKTLGGAFIVGGTAIGAGMLALPVVTASGGFLYESAIYIICYLFSMATGLLFVEICDWMPRESNIVSMSEHLLGKWGKWIAWVLYIFLFYTLTIAYVSAGGNLVTHLFADHIPQWLGICIFTLVFGAFLYAGTKAVDRINWLLMAGLVISFLAFLVMGMSDVKPEHLLEQSWKVAIFGLPVMFTSFSFQGTVPSLYNYLDRDPVQTRKAIIWGTCIPVVVYIVWEALILGMIPREVLIGAKKLGQTAIDPLRFLLKTKPVAVVGQFFAFFAITTSFLGVTLGLSDFLADGWQLKKTSKTKLLILALIFVPAVFIAATNPTIFLHALGLAGGFGCVLLLGLLPTLMVWVGRYRKNYTRIARGLPGEKWMLCMLLLFIVFELWVEVMVEWM